MSKVVYKVPECFLHSEAYLYYCQSCQEPICKKCTIIGPHNNQLHLCNHINQSYKVKVSQIQQLLNDSLPSKRQIVLSQVSRLQLAIQQTKTVKDNIIKYTKEQSLGILNRLEKQEQNKTLYLKNLILSLYKDLNSINDIGHQFEQISLESNPNKIIDLLSNYKRIQKQLQRLSNKIYNQTIDVSENDLPRELSQIRWKLKRKQSLIGIKKNKVLILSKVLQKRLEEEDKINKKVKIQFEDDLKSWKKESEYNLNSFKNYFLVCHFCGYTMNQDIINLECKQNGYLPKDFKGYCNTSPAYEYFGTSRHYFDQRANNSSLNPNDKVVDMYLKNLIAELKVQILYNNINIQKLIRSHDPNNSGYIKKLDIMYILVEKCKLSQDTASTIISSLPSLTNQKGVPTINYLNFVQLILIPNNKSV